MCRRFSREKKIIVRNGADTKGQVIGSEKGAFFSGAVREYDTWLTGYYRRGFWKITLRNVKTGEVFQARFQGRLGIGRISQGNENLAIDGDPMISKYHCCIWEETDRLYIQDAGSKNGTYINGKRIYEKKPLENGDIIRLGASKLLVQYIKV